VGNVSKAIEHYIVEHIQLQQSDITQSARSREWLLGRINSKIAERFKEPVLYTPTPFVYFGSYFKKTKVRVVDEYDVLVVIDSYGGQFSSGGQKTGVGQGSASPNYKYEGKNYFKSDDSGISPTKILNWLKGIVSDVVASFGGEAPIRNGQAITATIKSSNITIDLVPAGIFERVTDKKIFYNIPRGDKADGWITTAPEDDMAALNAVARDKDNFRNIIRICKRIKDTYNFKASSFAIEKIIVDYGNTYQWINDLYRDCRGALWYMTKIFREGTVSDPFSGNNLLDGVENLEWYAERIEKIVGVLDTCVNISDQTRVNELVIRAFENTP
jgi:hypothetical protein